MDDLVPFFAKLQALVEQGRFEELESDTIELKPCPATHQDWTERYKTINAFLNTRGGILILGIREEGQGLQRRYMVTGYDASAENKIKDIRTEIFTDSDRRKLDLTEHFPPPEILAFMGKRVVIQRVDELPAEKRYVFFKNDAYKRVLTGDHKVSQSEIDRHTEYLDEIAQARELETIDGSGLNDVDLGRLNEYILQLNQLQTVESLKPSLEAAIPFLMRKKFLINGHLTLLGGLVCASHPGDLLGFRSHVHGYVQLKSHDNIVVPDKQDMVANVLPLLAQANGYVLRNIQSGIGTPFGGSLSAQYPESVLRETINNAIAHRDYSLNKQIVISITPGQKIEISNPGKFRDQLLINVPPNSKGQTPILRVVPETKPKNPRLADVLRVYRKWEGRGIGMSTLVSLSLENRLNLPYFKFKSDEVTLVLQAGLLVDERINELFESRDAYISKKLGSLELLSDEKKAVLAYLIKSEWANAEGRYCVLLTPDNNHVQAIKVLENSGLICRDTRSNDIYPVYIVDRNLYSDSFEYELIERFGQAIEELPLLARRTLSVVYRYTMFSSRMTVNARETSFAMWTADGKDKTDIKAFDLFSRNMRRTFNQLEANGYITATKGTGPKRFVLAESLKGSQRALF